MNARFAPDTLARLFALLILASFTVALLPACSQSSDNDFNGIIPDILKQAAGGGANPIDTAADLFNTSSPDARRAAIQSIQDKPWGHDDTCMRAYRTLATDPSPMVRGQAMRALASSHDPAVADVLIAPKRGLNDADLGARRDASAALIDIRNPITIPLMLDRLKNDDDAQVRMNVARALKGFNDAKVLRALAEALDDRDVGVNYWAYRSLQETVNAELPNDGKACLQWVESHYAPTTAPRPS